MSVEGLLFSKYLMYRSVYWHRGVRSATAMIKKAVLIALEGGSLKSEALYGLDDEGFYATLRGLPSESLGLAREVFEGRTFACVLDLPFDDSKESHRSILDLEARMRIEEDLARGFGLGPADLAVDLPEGVSFETDLLVLRDASAARGDKRPALPFAESPTVFSPPVVQGFARSLRRLRLFAREGSDRLGKAALELFQ